MVGFSFSRILVVGFSVALVKCSISGIELVVVGFSAASVMCSVSRLVVLVVSGAPARSPSPRVAGPSSA